MELLAHQRCLHHASREAVARCPECAQFFCRECITEHDDRVICAACLRRLARPTLRERFRWLHLGLAGQLILGVLTAWLFFYLAGRTLVVMPADFHEGTLWRDEVWEP
jgi:hypothetical protein